MPSCIGDTPANLAAGQKWHNELGSTMVITTYDPETGIFGGEYQSLVGDAKKSYVLTGRRDTEGLTMGWTVNWQNKYMNAHSVTTWSGQFSREPSIVTTWLLTTQTSPEDSWESTQVGFDVFTLSPPTKESTEQAKLRCRKSHHKDA